LSWLKPSTKGSPEWVHFLIQQIQEASYQHKPSLTVPHHKHTKYRERAAYVIKSKQSRLRIILQQGQGSEQHLIHAYVSVPVPAVRGSPYLPRFPLHGDVRIHHTTWPISELGLTDLYLSCMKWLSERTFFSEVDHARTPLSMTPGQGFAFGKIIKTKFYTHHPKTKEGDGWWELDISEGYINEELTPSQGRKLIFPEIYYVRANAIKFYNGVAVGYVLIYKNETEADIASLGAVKAFCKILP
jgi:hypothetical protein